MTAAAPLLAEFEALTHRARMGRMVELGRLPESQREPVLEGLRSGSVYERRLALWACHGSRDAEQAYRAALDPSGHVAGPALRLVALLCSEKQFFGLLDALPTSRHVALVRRWKMAGRPATPVDAWIEQLLSAGRRSEVWALLPYAGPELARTLLLAALDEGNGRDWQRLARRFPRLVGEEVLRRANAATELDSRLISQATAVRAELMEQERGLALALTQELGRTAPLSQLNLWSLVRPAPEQVASLLLGSPDPVYLDLTPALRRLSNEQIERLLLQRRSNFPGAEGAFGRLRPQRRHALAPAFLAAFTSPQGVVPLELATRLPSDLRESEARRHLALPALQTRPLQRLPYAGLLPWDEAHAAVDNALRHPDAELRGQAIASLLSALRYERGRQAEALQLVTARRNEQDPVRGRMLWALADLPPGLWQAGSLAALGQVIQDALNAADLSFSTAQSAERLLVGLLPFQPGWGAAWLGQLVQARGQVNFGSLERRLTPGSAAVLIAALLPVLRGWETREREGQLLGAIRSFGRYVGQSPDLQDILERLVQQSAETWTSVGALGVLAEHSRERFALLVQHLLARDASWGTQPLVYGHVHRHRQDLLMPLLGRQASRGRFSTGKTRFVLPLSAGSYRWTVTQQQLFAQTLTEVSQDTGRDFPGVIRALHQLAALPSPVRPPARASLLSRLTGLPRPAEDLPLRRLTELATLENSVLALRDTAVRMLGRLDAARGLPALLDMLEDDRARIAIYTLRRPLLDVPPTEALKLLGQVPRERVTVVKEVLRLIGDLPGEAAYQALLNFGRDDLHRDARVALLRGLWNHLNRPETWPLLLSAAQSGDAGLSSGLVRLPAQQVTAAYRPQYLALLSALLVHADPVVRLETLRFHAAVTDPERQILGVLLGAMASPHAEEAQAAARVVFASYSGRDAPALAAAFSALLPQRRALVQATVALQGAASAAPHKAASIVRAVLDALAADPLTLHLQVRLAVATLGWPDLAARLLRWAEADQLHPEVLMDAVNAVLGAGARTDLSQIHVLEELLAGGPPETRRIALAALTVAAQAPGAWTPQRLERLRTYRADAAVLVASAAQFTLPAAEVQGGAAEAQG
ncbi:hypothetical protein E7T06_19110 [Deinococcus sp. Arct2-2]|uniref:hypothetical protein n=1 Tax=Deinococcus sp. Arct2-2 TaxID=2568653 RepID=UPI0010A425FC|nr:hypothetical protein [Deinococcus sp. Arct2-2]THF67828.1 hypothetical protein E7T06_19110 [Deinococcus sp. Arct2-2]